MLLVAALLGLLVGIAMLTWDAVDCADREYSEYMAEMRWCHRMSLSEWEAHQIQSLFEEWEAESEEEIV